MEDLARSEYPAMLANLQPMQAVHTLTDRVKRINKLNVEIADWLQERRRVEEQYVQGLRRLINYKAPNAQSDLGVFQIPWDKVLHSIDSLAHSHHVFASRLEKDVETPLRTYSTRKEVQNIQTIAANLTSMAKDLEEAQDKSEKLSKKAGKANSQKVDAVSSKLDSATSQWESQAPFIFETLQVLDEQRVAQLRDLLTQFQTHESDKALRNQATAEAALTAMLEISTDQEVQAFVQRVTTGKPKLEKRTSTRQSSSLAASSTLAPPSSGANDDETTSETSTPNEIKSESRLRRIGTMLGRRRQSIHGGFGQISPQKTSLSFGRLGSSHGRGVSPRASVNDLSSVRKLSSLAESPESPKQSQASGAKDKPQQEATNGIAAADGTSELAPVRTSSSAVNGTDGTETPTPSGAPASRDTQEASGPTRDSEGYTIPPPTADPITIAERDAQDESEQLFKLNIQSSPVADEDPDAKQAAMSNVANTLTQMGMPSRKTGTIRGRRDVRNTIYVPSPTTAESGSENAFPHSPALLSVASRPAGVAALASETSAAGTSDTQSVRSATSLSSLAQVKHPEMLGPGLNCSIIETMSAAFEGGTVKGAKISGEIAFSYNAGAASDPDDNKETVRINNFPNLEVIGPNRIFVQNTSPDRNDHFNLDVSHLAKTATAFTYRIHSEDSDGTSLGVHAPLLIRPAWKPQGDKLGLLLQYGLNPSSSFTAPLTLHNVVIFATYEGARASGAQTKPSGTHLKDKHLVYWRLGDVTLKEEPQKIVCRIVGAENAEPKPGQVEARWEYWPPTDATASLSGISVSRAAEAKGKGKEVAPADDPFADENPTTPGLPPDQTWREVPLVYKLVSAKYEAKEDI